ncbi:hypothetical protein EVG20_g4657 [Dentipellis fragilis]|uniref:Multiple myeloma tumor-associated protein 2-like N-terminal domain-containing protein n=1 Tax=Dentipellis fragilis TaxID=205917 RepID=A0A4Y9YXF1_9AGAM|nr:hypothetical protein EVG20_g4657 [Dentipellis fragilis]
MFEPVRGGTRGGQAEFKWSDVSADKDRENYLGHSINAPTGRWQKNKDIHWYDRELQSTAEERAEEIRKIKEAEAEALSAALGFGPSQKGGATATASAGPTTGANAMPTGDRKPSDAELQKALEKEERRKRKAERKAEKLARKEERRAERSRHKRDEDDSSRERDHGRPYDRWRSRSPVRRSSKDVRRPGSGDTGALAACHRTSATLAR